MRHSLPCIERETDFTATGTTLYCQECRVPSEIRNWKSYFATGPYAEDVLQGKKPHLPSHVLALQTRIAFFLKTLAYHPRAARLVQQRFNRTFSLDKCL